MLYFTGIPFGEVLGGGGKGVGIVWGALPKIGRHMI